MDSGFNQWPYRVVARNFFLNVLSYVIPLASDVLPLNLSGVEFAIPVLPIIFGYCYKSNWCCLIETYLLEILHMDHRIFFSASPRLGFLIH